MALMVYRAISSYSGVNICSVVSDWWEIAEISQTSVLITQIWVILAENGNKQWPDFWVLSAFFSPISFDIYRYKISWTDVGPWRVKPVSSRGVILFVCWPARGPFPLRSLPAPLQKQGTPCGGCKSELCYRQAAWASKEEGPDSGALHRRH